MIKIDRLINSISVFYKMANAIDTDLFSYFLKRQGYRDSEIESIKNKNKEKIEYITSKYIKDVPRIIESGYDSMTFLVGKGNIIILSNNKSACKNSYEYGTLKYYDPIYWCVKEYEPKESFETKYPELVHYSFIASFITSLGQSWEVAERFIKENKNKINKLMRSFYHAPKLLGTGLSPAMAFDIGNGMVIKLFIDKFSYKKSIEAFNRLYDNPELADTEIRLYDVGTLGVLNNTTEIYYLIIENVDTSIIKNNLDLKSSLSVLIHEISFLIETNNREQLLDLKNKIDDKSFAQYVSNIINKNVDMIYNHIVKHNKILIDNINIKVKNLRSDWLKNLIREIIVKYITGRGDLHMGNIGLTGYGHFRYFDPAHVNWVSKINA